MRFEFALPDLGEGLTEGEIGRWLVSEGQERLHGAVSAVLSFHGGSVAVDSNEKLRIARSREFGVLKGFEQAELLSWGIATGLAIMPARAPRRWTARRDTAPRC